MIITVCIGSGCHVKGSRRIIAILQTLIERYRLDGRIELEGCFCRERCTEGVVLTFDGAMVTGVTPDNVEAIFERQVPEARP